MLNELENKPVVETSTKASSTSKQIRTTSTTTTTTTTATTTIATTATTTIMSTTTSKLTTNFKKNDTIPFKTTKHSTRSTKFMTEIGKIESSKSSANITNSTPLHKNFTSNQLSIITLSALLGCIYGVAFIMASTWIGWLWLKRRKRKSESSFKSSRMETDFNTLDSNNCIHRT